jgi:cytochrome b6-f complex iron-sulfur subunit
MSESIGQRGNGTQTSVLPSSRRGFLKYAMLTFSAVATAAGVLTPIVAYLWPPSKSAAAGSGRVAVASTADLPVGKGAVYSVNNAAVIVINTAEGYKALSAVCTHLGCIVSWNEKEQVIACPCHDAAFNTNGAVLKGPPPAPLPTHRVQVEGDKIWVEGEAA